MKKREGGGERQKEGDGEIDSGREGEGWREERREMVRGRGSGKE